MRKNLVLAYKEQNFEKIFENNEKLYGAINPELLTIASQKVFEKAQNQPKNIEKILGKMLSLDEIQVWVENYLKKLGIENIPVKMSSTTFSRMAVAYKKNSVVINISLNAKIREKELESILAHEVGTHLRRYLAGTKTGLKIFENGLAYYLSDEEWLAVYNSLRVLPKDFEKNSAYFNYYAIAQADMLSFSQLIALLQSMYPERSFEKNFSSATRLKRGIVDTSISGIRWISYQKDKVYLDGYYNVKNWIENGGNVDSLYFWKIRISDLSLISQL